MMLCATFLAVVLVVVAWRFSIVMFTCIHVKIYDIMLKERVSVTDGFSVKNFSLFMKNAYLITSSIPLLERETARHLKRAGGVFKRHSSLDSMFSERSKRSALRKISCHRF